MREYRIRSKDIVKVTLNFLKIDKGKSLKRRSRTCPYSFAENWTEPFYRAGRWSPSRDQTSLRDENRSEHRAPRNNKQEKGKRTEILKGEPGEGTGRSKHQLADVPLLRPRDSCRTCLVFPFQYTEWNLEKRGIGD